MIAMTKKGITRLFLVRHGATTLSAEDRFAGATDVDLSDEGVFQATCLAGRLSDDSIVAAYCSPMIRTRRTAAIIAKPHGLIPEERDGLREIHHGHWEGMRRATVERKFRAEYLDWEADPYTFAPEGGETGASVVARTLPVIREIVTKHEGKNVLVVSHKATIRLLISSVLGFDNRNYRDRLDQLPACLNVLDFKGMTYTRLMLFNDVSHYMDHPLRSSGRLSSWWDTSRNE